MKRALILGVGGQDGSYLADILLEKGYEVHGLYRRSSVDNLWRIAKIRDRIILYQGDLTDRQSINNAILASQPHEIYNEADQDDVRWSHHIPEVSFDVTAAAVGRLLNFVNVSYRDGILHNSPRIFQPLSATMFGMLPPPQNLDTPLMPQSPYACAKAAAWYLCQHYRREHGLHIVCGIMFNHDSPTRSDSYILHKICKAAARISQGRQEKLEVVNPETRFDVGYARDYMEIAWELTSKEPSTRYACDYIIGTGFGHSINFMIKEAFITAGVPNYEDKVMAVVIPTKSPTLIAAPVQLEAMNLMPKTSLKALIKMIVQHYLEN